VVGTWFGTGFPGLPVEGDPAMAIRITGDTMVLKIDNRVVAAARFGEHAAADGNGAWTVSNCRARLFNRDQAMTALMVVESPEGRHHQKPMHADHGVRA
jgi:hypothetical protein